MQFTKREVKDTLGIQSDAELARFFKTSRQAVDLWVDEKPIPYGRQWELRAREPDLFPEPEKANAAPKQDAA